MDKNDFSPLDEIRKIYDDTTYFIDAIVEEYGFYGGFLNALSKGRTTVSASKKIVRRSVDDDWMGEIEKALPALDTVIRNHSVGIEEVEEVLPIEFSKHINNRSIRHLAQHTDYIADMTEDGTITPNKILNVFAEETMMTYENKFVNTLIDRLYYFVEKRYQAVSGESAITETGIISCSGEYQFGKSTGKISISIENTSPDESSKTVSSCERLTHIRDIIIKYMGSDFVKNMKGALVRPPILRTNAISKNKYLRQCLDLWDYIESYENPGYNVTADSTEEKPSKEYVKQMYGLLSLQYMMYRYNMEQERLKNLEKPDIDERMGREFTPRIITKESEIESDSYNVYDTVYKKVFVTKSGANRRALGKDEKRIRAAVTTALKEQKSFDATYFEKPKKAKKKSGEATETV